MIADTSEIARIIPALPPTGPFLRGILVERFNRTCHYCRRQSDSYTSDPDGQPWNTDHVKPLSLGGPHTLDNVVLACRSCNSSKGVKDAPKPLSERTPLAVKGNAPQYQQIMRGQSVVRRMAKHHGSAFISLSPIAYEFHTTVRALAEMALGQQYHVESFANGVNAEPAAIIWLTEQLTGLVWEDLGGSREGIERVGFFHDPHDARIEAIKAEFRALAARDAEVEAAS